MEKEFDLKLDNQLCFSLYTCSRKIISSYQPYLSELKITYTQYLVFLALFEEDPLTVNELSKKLYLDSGTLSPLLKKLEKEGYINKERNKDDERVVYISLTNKGKEMKLKLKEIPCLVYNKLQEELSVDEILELFIILNKYRNK